MGTGQARAGRPLRRLRRLARDTAAVTPVVGTIMILAISAFGLAVVFAWGLPSLKQTQAEAEIDAVYDQFLSMEEMLQNIMRSGASGKASSGGISFSQGELKRTEGNLLAVSVHHQTFSANDSHRYRVSILDPGDPLVIQVEGVNDANLTDRYVDAYMVDPDQEKQIDSRSAWTNDKIELTIDREDIGEGTLRVRVMHEAKPTIGEPDPFTLMQSWVFPLGAVEYTRDTNFGVTSVILEMGALVTDYETGNHVHTDPLLRSELDAEGDPRFVSLFAPVMTGGPNDAALESTGAGTHELRLLLNLNILQIPGQDVKEADMHMVGPRNDTWYEHFEDRHGWELNQTDSGETRRAVMAAGEGKDFEFALMESRIHVESQKGATRIDV